MIPLESQLESHHFLHIVLKVLKMSHLNFGIFHQILYYKIRRGPKLEGYVFANFGYSSGTEGESRHEMGNSCWVSFKTGLYFRSLRAEERSNPITSFLRGVANLVSTALGQK